MGSQLNVQAMRAYSQSVAMELCERFFPKRKNVITYHKMTSLCSIKQVNLFILKILFDVWNREMSRWKSPYFHYHADDLLKTRVRFFNAVVKTATFPREATEAILAKAVEDTLWLLFSPYTFYTQVLDIKEESEVTLDELKTISKYIIINKKIMKMLLADLKQAYLEPFLGKQVIHTLTQVFEKIEEAPEEVSPYLESFVKILPYKESFYIQDGKEQKWKMKEELAHEFNKLPYTLNQILTDYEVEPKRTKSILTFFTSEQKEHIIKDLFYFDESEFLKVIYELDRCLSNHQVVGLINAVYVSRYKWNIESESYKKFLHTIETRFS